MRTCTMMKNPYSGRVNDYLRNPPPEIPSQTHFHQEHPPRLPTSAPVLVFQIFTRLSSDPVATCFPPGEKVTEKTGPVCPVSVHTCHPTLTSDHFLRETCFQRHHKTTPHRPTTLNAIARSCSPELRSRRPRSSRDVYLTRWRCASRRGRKQLCTPSPCDPPACATATHLHLRPLSKRNLMKTQNVEHPPDLSTLDALPQTCSPRLPSRHSIFSRSCPSTR
jgi:hypothetical protein